jgi:hypothetical protein
MDTKLFRRLTESMRQHSEIERRERAPSRVTTSRHDVLPAPAYNPTVPSSGGPTAMSTPSTKRQAHDLIDALPDSATWEDLAYEVELRASIERGLADSDAGRVVAVEDLMKELGIEE